MLKLPSLQGPHPASALECRAPLGVIWVIGDPQIVLRHRGSQQIRLPIELREREAYVGLFGSNPSRLIDVGHGIRMVLVLEAQLRTRDQGRQVIRLEFERMVEISHGRERLIVPQISHAAAV